MTLIARLIEVYRQHADPSTAAPMQAYMRDRFKFLGIPGPARRELSKPLLAGRPTERDVLEAALACWALPEREYQYFACEYLRRHCKTLSAAEALPVLRTLITTRSWWDTVDALAVNVVGVVVAADQRPMDAFAADENLWLVRTALLHQLKYRERTDVERLYKYIGDNCEQSDFFIRKGIGWALREHAKTDPESVRAFVAATPGLSGLSVREALKNIGRPAAATKP